MKRFSFRFLTLLLTGTFVTSNVNAQEEETDSPDDYGMKVYDFEVTLSDDETYETQFVFSDHQGFFLEDEDINTSGIYYVYDDMLYISVNENDFVYMDDDVNVQLHLSYDALDGSEINGTVEDVTVKFESNTDEASLEQYSDIHERVVGQEYTMTLTEESEPSIPLLMNEPVEELYEVENDVYLMNMGGYDEIVYLDEQRRFWGSNGINPDSVFQQLGYYTIDDSNLDFYIMNLFGAGETTRMSVTYTQSRSGEFEGEFTDLEFISFDRDAPREFEEQRESRIGEAFEMVKLEQDEIIGELVTFAIGQSDETIEVMLEENGVATITHLDEEIAGTYSLEGNVLVLEIDESGVTTRLYVENAISLADVNFNVGIFLAPMTDQGFSGTINRITHEFDSEVTDLNMDEFESQFELKEE